MAFMLNFVVYTPVSAYYSSSSLVPVYFSSNKTVSFDSNGILLIQDFVRTGVERSLMPNSDQPLIFDSFVSGTWQGQSVSSLSSLKLCDQSDTVGFSHSVSIVTSGSYFVYFVQIALPVVAGDSFTFSRNYSSYAKSLQGSFYTFLPSCSGVRKCWIQSGLVPNVESFDFNLTSENQFYFLCFSADKFGSWSSPGPLLSFSSSSSNSYNKFNSLTNATFVSTNYISSICVSNFGLSVGDTISISLKDSTTAFCLVGFEIFTDGSTFPGLDDSEHMGGSSDDDFVGSTDLTGVHSRLDAIIALLEASGSFFTPEDFWEVYKSGLEELFGIEDSEPAEPPPEGSEQETTESTTSPFDVGIDEEQVDEALSYVSTDLGDTVTGSGGALSFFWFITDRFLTTCDLYVVAGLSLMFCLGCWILRS